MANTTNFTDFATGHPNYFPGQYLLEDDFELQHKYLSDRDKYHHRSLHVSGILEGLTIELIANKKSIQIKSGSAINSKGELIVLKQDKEFSDFKNITNGELYLQYIKETKLQQQKDVPDSYTRWVEEPIVGFAATVPDKVLEDSLKLAKLTISGDTITIDNSVREYSGLSLPNSNSKALTLRSGGNTNPNLAVLTGSLKIDGNLTVSGNLGIGIENPGNYKLNIQGNQYISGDLTVNGTISGKIDTSKITSGILTVDRIPNLSADKIDSGTLAVDRIPNLSASKINSGELSSDRIPKLSADKINSGTLGVDRIPNLSADKINSGTLGVDRIPNLAASKIASGELSSDRVPNLSADKITSGVLGVDRIPNLSASKITSGDLSVGKITSQGINVEYNRSDHINVDGAFYRYDGQVYITTDDNLYIRDHNRSKSIQLDVANQKINYLSDSKLKKNIQPLVNGLQKILSLHGVSFQWKEDKLSQQTNSQLGLIAQDVEKIFPELVQIGNDGMRYMNYTGLIAPLIEAIKEQQSQIDKLTEKIVND
jgi:Chaperone of endosialidase